MKIVIDVGCARYNGDYSIERLIEHFEPEVLYGFDPAWKRAMYEPIYKTDVICSRKVAWTRSGTVRFLPDGLNGQVGDADHWPLFTCFDLALFIQKLPDGDEIILKLDCEGSEYDLLEHLIATGTAERLSLVWVEWHPLGPNPAGRRLSIESRLRCQVDEWLW